MEFKKLTGITSAFFISTLLNSQSIQAEDYFDIEKYKNLTDCTLLSKQGKVTSAFLGMLDSHIHGYTENLFEMTPQQREPYIQAAIRANSSRPPQFIRAMFEGPYKQYATLQSEEERIRYLSEKLDRFHHLSSNDIFTLTASCK